MHHARLSRERASSRHLLALTCQPSFAIWSLALRFPTAVVLQEVWEAQAAVVERNMKAVDAEGGAAEGAADGGSPAQQHGMHEAQLQRLLAADVVLVPYGVLSQEV
jgi:hypothetical protein